MTEATDTPPPDQPAEPEPLPPPPSRSRQPWLAVAGFVVLAAAILYVWQYPTVPPDPRIATLAQQVSGLEARVTRLEQRPVSDSADMASLAARVAMLEQRPTASEPAQPPASAPAPNLAPLEARIAALEAKQPAETQLTAQVDTLGSNLRAQQADLARRLDSDEARLATMERNAGQIATLADRANRLARIQAAQAALDAGQSLGELPGAPAALARFATATPPTLASLRLAFPDAARAALSASRPVATDKPLLERIWASAQDLVTIRQDGRVIVGDPAAAALDQAGIALDAGDLAAAVNAVASLSGPPAQAMAGWLAEARALLAARAALAEMAAHV